MKRLLLFVFPGLAGLTIGCGGTPAGSPGIPEAVRSVPALPSGAARQQVSREASSYVFSAVDMVECDGATISGSDIRLGSSNLNYIILGINTGQRAVTSLKSEGFMRKLWLGVSDYGHGRWSWLGGAHNADGEVELPDGALADADGNLYLLVLTPPGGLGKIRLELGIAPDPGRWNMLVWLAADNNLGSYAWKKLNELEMAGSDENVTILAGFDIDEKELELPPNYDCKVHFMKVVHDTDPDSLVVDGDPANQVFGSDGYNSARTYSVVQFLEWAEQNFPAQHTMLVLDDHGTGWLPGRRTGSQVQPPRDPSAILLDSDDGPGMADTGELAAAIAPYHFDVLYLQACNMGQVEVAYDFRNAADWIVTSEAVLWEPGCAFSGVVSAWQAAFPLCARDVARLIPDQTYLRYGSDQPLSMAVIKAAGIEPLVAAIDKLAAWIAIGPAADRAYFYAGYRLLDIIPESSGERDLDAAIDNFLYYQPSAINRQAAQDVLGLLNTTIDRTRFVKYVGMAGLSIYLPDSPAQSSGQIGLYQQTAFGADTHWVQMLESL